MALVLFPRIALCINQDITTVAQRSNIPDDQMTSKPRHWPENVQFIDKYHYHKSVPQTVRSFVQGDRTRQTNASRPPVVIRAIASPSHPANGQFGLFAAKKIPPDTHIMDYIGEIHCDDRPNSNYDLSLYRYPDGLSVGIDASVVGNEARFINDFRGVQPRPNAVFTEKRNGDGELRMSIWSSKDVIKRGDEVLVSYGKAWWRARSDNANNME
ncbi:hypothetical protein PC9H_003953 [Pleurotus ostreatus]|uniref:SET domain-containing protein n=3 Tax=Pleurotus TaxID=5320 RepID=A0A8H7DUD7_PLEOS|nr:uncharacterized protein PC9H_003953 [Pleurotus ostreatus]KAF7437119.1 hypothetical protein PC9H_003953 [Pleurotus ostreatus]KAG9223084.1 hypothetical protein CCMSSC00406_0000227 [Pleurotus cornucopiae]